MTTETSTLVYLIGELTKIAAKYPDTGTYVSWVLGAVKVRSELEAKAVRDAVATAEKAVNP